METTSNQSVDLLMGDLLFERTNSWLARIIRWATKDENSPSWTNHVAGIVGPGMVCEALWKVTIHSLDDFAKSEYKIYRNIGLDESQRHSVASAALAYNGRRYGWLKLIAHLLDAVIYKLTWQEIFLFRRLCRMDKYPICSWVWAWAYKKGCGYKFGVDCSYADPDHMWDQCTENDKENWKLITYHKPE